MKKRYVTILAIVGVILIILSMVIPIWIYGGFDTDQPKESEVLKTIIKEQSEITEMYKNRLDSLLDKRNRFDLEKQEKEIKDKYDKKRDSIFDGSIDSTISDLTEWLPKG